MARHEQPEGCRKEDHPDAGRRGLLQAGGISLLGASLVAFAPILRRDFFPEMDAGAFEVAVRAAPGLRIEKTEDQIAPVPYFENLFPGGAGPGLTFFDIGVTSGPCDPTQTSIANPTVTQNIYNQLTCGLRGNETAILEDLDQFCFPQRKTLSFQFSPVSGFAPSEGIVEVAMTVLSQSDAGQPYDQGLVTGTAQLSGTSGRWGSTSASKLWIPPGGVW